MARHEVELPAHDPLKKVLVGNKDYAKATESHEEPFFDEEGNPIEEAVVSTETWEVDMIITLESHQYVTDSSDQTFETLVGARPKDRTGH